MSFAVTDTNLFHGSRGRPGEEAAGAFRVSCSAVEVKANAGGPPAARGGLLLLRVGGGGDKVTRK